jgi:hypothetical protein
VLLVVEVVSPGSETTDRVVKVDQYARAGIPFYWRLEQAATGVPIIYTYVLDPATRAYRGGEVFTGAIKAAAPFSVTVDLGTVRQGRQVGRPHGGAGRDPHLSPLPPGRAVAGPARRRLGCRPAAGGGFRVAVGRKQRSETS